VGPGNVLAGLTRRIVQGARTTAVSDPDHLRQILAEAEQEAVKA
jgi:malonyl CoA-acyl carrier protein transacylase